MEAAAVAELEVVHVGVEVLWDAYNKQTCVNTARSILEQSVPS